MGARARSAAAACRLRLRAPSVLWATPAELGGEGKLSAGSCLQLAFELVQETPVGAVGNDPLRARLDEPHFVQPQGVKPDGVLGIIFPPFIVRNVTQGLDGIIVARGKAAIDKLLRGTP